MKPEAGFDSRDLLRKLGHGHAITKFVKNQTIFAQGDKADSVYLLLQGRIKVVVLSVQGKEAATGMVAPGQFFGEGCLVGEPIRSATTIAMQNCVVAIIAGARLIETLRAQPDFAELFVRHLLLRNRRIEEDLLDQLLNCSEKRLARLLLRLAEFDGGGQTQPIATHISQETLAEMIGTTRSRVSYFMNKFRKLGLISYDRTIEVDHVRLAAVLHDRAEARS
ncbi:MULTISPECIES: Crp/Fnr family transcriptional regulator [Rhodopseudomonas]|uniref:Crp/Fnr family transcriptional regulator n=1 Tax=Rhodopseudomonas TaxID=1073 RepID=UPI0006426603|nr:MULTISPECIES: Crp/Fnr family transcriptional regulator [Rhodopseudomonas]NEW87934.1 Crp/Fnr family transcriptional regulator [Rhodopseudomonas sp. WA056]QDL98969.1 Crp/Fnr family transcriptional regulator [Rhodopseudomonas palustris]